MLSLWMKLYPLIAMSTVNASVVGVSEMNTLTLQVHPVEGSLPAALRVRAGMLLHRPYPIGEGGEGR